jgi:DNA-binding transcriptional LysR family regulator
VQRLVVAEFGHALGIVQAVASTDLIVCVPKRLAEMYASHADVVIAPPPFDSPVVDISQYWHERMHHDAGHRWLRSVVFRRFGD